MGPGIDGGTIWLLRMFDVGDELDLERARAVLDTRGARRGGAMLRGPEKGPGVVFAAAPLDVELGQSEVDGVAIGCSARLFDFGVVSIRLEVPIQPGTPFESLVRTAAGLEHMTAIDETARALCERLERELAACIRGHHAVNVVEDYTVFELRRVAGFATAEAALATLDVGSLILAEPDRPIAADLEGRYRKRAIQYYADDAVVISWNAAVVIDPDGGRDVLEVLEIATAQLLELRYYDKLLARELAQLYDAAQAARRGIALLRSPYVTVARRAATLFMEMTDLYDRLQGSVTLVGDAYTVRLYSDARHRMRLEEISAAVQAKLDTLAKVAEIFEAEIGHRRATILEVTVVALILLEIVLSLFRH